MSDLDLNPVYRQITSAWDGDTMQSHADNGIKDGFRFSDTYKKLEANNQNPDIAWEIDAQVTPPGPVLDDDHMLANTDAPNWKGTSTAPIGYVFNQASQELFDFHFKRGKYKRPDVGLDEMGQESYGFVSPENSARHANEKLKLTPAEITQFGLDFSGTLNFGLTTLGMEYARLRDAPQDVKAAILAIHHITNSPDWNRDTGGMSWDGTFRLGREIIRDPISYFGFSSIQALMGAGRTLATKAGVQSPFMKNLASVLFGSQVVGGESAALAYYQNVLQQRTLGAKDINRDQAMQAAKYGYVGGMALYPAILGGASAGRGAWNKVKAIAKDASQGRTASMFLGPSAEGVDQAALAEAKRMKKSNVDREEIRQSTGWFYDKKGNWKTEASDIEAEVSLKPTDVRLLKLANIEVQTIYPDAPAGHDKVTSGAHFVDVSAGTDAPVRMTLDDLKSKYADNPSVITAAERIDNVTKGGTVGSVLDHPRVIEAYPWIAEVPFQLDTSVDRTGVRSSLDLRKKDAGTQMRFGMHAGLETRKTMLHEVQHLIQMREDWPRGGGVKEFEITPEIEAGLFSHLSEAVGRIKWLEFQDTNPGKSKSTLWKQFKEIYREKMNGEEVPKDVIMASKDELPIYQQTAQVIQRAFQRGEKPFESYERLAGEAEARLVEQRAGLTDANIRASNPLDEMQTSRGEKLTEDDLIYAKEKNDPGLFAEKKGAPDKPVQHTVQTEVDNPSSIVNMLYNAAGEPPPSPTGKKWTKADLAKHLDQQAEQAGRKITEFDDAAADTISDTITNETVAALGRKGNASGWYNEDIKKAIETVNKIHPEIKRGNSNEGMFMLGLAITSNGKTVDYNFKAAEHLYQHFKNTGKFPDDAKSLEAAVGGFGQELPTLVGSMRKANAAINRWGVGKFVKFLNTEFTVRELEAAGFAVSSEGKDYLTHGSVIFGPKIGGGFYQNLVGNFKPITFDRWWTYSWGRWTGNAIKTYSEKGLKGQLETFRARFAEELKASGLDEKAFEKKMPKTERGLLPRAQEIYKTYKKNNFQPRTKLNQAAQRFVEARTPKMELEPGSSGNRNYMRKTALSAIEKLNKLGYNVTPADLQATVWYPEKELHRHFNIGTSRSDPDSYSLAAERFLKEYRKGAKGGRRK